MPGKTLVVLGSGPGIGVGVAQTFAVRGFTHIALVSRDGKRLGEDENKVLDAVQERGYSCQIKTWVCDLADSAQLKKTLGEIESFGSLECVLWNAARVTGKPPLEETVQHIQEDFNLTNLALYEAAQWAIPKLKEVSGEDRSPSFFVTSTTQLYKEPLPDLVSLSMVKCAQRALVLSINAKYGKDVHVALLSVGGVVAPGKNNSPANIADVAWSLYKQPKDGWKREAEIDE